MVNKPIKISGCYRFTITGELWNTLNIEERYKALQHTRYLEPTITKLVYTDWSDMSGFGKKIITGELKSELMHFANRKYHGVENIDRRTKLCPDSVWYSILKDKKDRYK